MDRQLRHFASYQLHWAAVAPFLSSEHTSLASHLAKVQQVLETVLHEQPRHNAHSGGQAGGAHTLPLQRALVNACGGGWGWREQGGGVLTNPQGSADAGGGAVATF